MFSKNWREVDASEYSYPLSLSMGDYWNLNKEILDAHFHSLSTRASMVSTAVENPNTGAGMSFEVPALPQNGNLEVVRCESGKVIEKSF